MITASLPFDSLTVENPKITSNAVAAEYASHSKLTGIHLDPPTSLRLALQLDQDQELQLLLIGL